MKLWFFRSSLIPAAAGASYARFVTREREAAIMAQSTKGRADATVKWIQNVPSSTAIIIVSELSLL